jgi:2-dehydro-3-deoxyphosphogalactonate aldolase
MNTMNSRDSLTDRFATAIACLPLVAVLRGLMPEEAGAVGQALYGAGFRLIEVPLNSPDPFASVANLRGSLPGDALVGAGTVMSAGQAAQMKDAGGEMVFMPHSDLNVVRAAKSLGLLCVPGVLTPTEAFAALAVGADGLKLFPGEMITPKVIKALRAVLPKGTLLLPFGGVKPETMKPYIEAGANAFGVGSAVYSPGLSPSEVAGRALVFADAWRSLSEA